MKKLLSPFLLCLLFLNAQEEVQDIQTDTSPNKPEVLEKISKAPKDHDDAIERFTPHDQKTRKHREEIKIIPTQEVIQKAKKCEEGKDFDACFEVGMIFYQGRSNYGQNLQEAYFYLEQSCNAQRSLGCYEAGIIAAHSKEKKANAPKLLDRSCSSGDLRGCRNLATLYYNGIGIAKNQYVAMKLFKTNCNKGDTSSCQKFYYALGKAYEKSKNLVGAKLQYQQGCSYGDKSSCEKLKKWGVQSSLKSQEQSLKQDQRKQASSLHSSKTELQSP